ncbi:hypothetical protein K458DRAFT_398571 [Lentithecium fluviatile CBS 122367]|uniref:Uncharacterized protein n=1 Tax=Lentithecium fluviatile CBS 122367 TaxID=1168545 RepID=A0A6G1JPB3_9PLEO|nr:hypothetical protein K458DRAFT_398571 [Lentithecium fluviatile CBS 122367]
MKLFALAYTCALALPSVLAESCSYWDDGVTYHGTCGSPVSCNNAGNFYVDNQCSGGSNNKCCIEQACRGVAGWCLNSNTSAGKNWCSLVGGHFVSNRCPGPDAVKCCQY